MSGHVPLLRRIRFTELTLGIVCGSQILCAINWSLISHANMPGFSCLQRRIFLTTVGVATCYSTSHAYLLHTLYYTTCYTLAQLYTTVTVLTDIYSLICHFPTLSQSCPIEFQAYLQHYTELY